MHLIEFPPTHPSSRNRLIFSAPFGSNSRSRLKRFPPRAPHHCQMFKSNMHLQCVDHPRGGTTGCLGTQVHAWAARVPLRSATSDPVKCVTPCLCCLRLPAKGRWSHSLPSILWENSQGPIAVYPSWRLLCLQIE